MLLTFIFEILAELHDKLPGMTRNDCAVVLQNNSLQLQSPFSLVLWRSRPKRALLPGVVEGDYVKAQRFTSHLFN